MVQLNTSPLGPTEGPPGSQDAGDSSEALQSESHTLDFKSFQLLLFEPGCRPQGKGQYSVYRQADRYGGLPSEHPAY